MNLQNYHLRPTATRKARNAAWKKKQKGGIQQWKDLKTGNSIASKVSGSFLASKVTGNSLTDTG